MTPQPLLADATLPRPLPERGTAVYLPSLEAAGKAAEDHGETKLGLILTFRDFTELLNEIVLPAAVQFSTAQLILLVDGIEWGLWPPSYPPNDDNYDSDNSSI